MLWSQPCRPAQALRRSPADLPPRFPLQEQARCPNIPPDHRHFANYLLLLAERGLRVLNGMASLEPA